MYDVLYGNQQILENVTTSVKMELQLRISEKLGLGIDEFYLISNGRRVKQDSIICEKVYIILRTPGGKGGFGSMLRAIGAQIEKTTNREACRDLSGRRLRDINEEQRLKKWVAEQADREKEAKDKKKKKLEKLLERPKHTFVDKEYDEERSSLPEKVEDAVLKGLEASCSTKRKSDDSKGKVVKKKPKLWMDSELDEDLSSESDEDPQSSFDNQSLSCPSQALQSDCTKISENNLHFMNQTDIELSSKSELSESSK